MDKVKGKMKQYKILSLQKSLLIRHGIPNHVQSWTFNIDKKKLFKRRSIQTDLIQKKTGNLITKYLYPNDSGTVNNIEGWEPKHVFTKLGKNLVDVVVAFCFFQLCTPKKPRPIYSS